MPQCWEARSNLQSNRRALSVRLKLSSTVLNQRGAYKPKETNPQKKKQVASSPNTVAYGKAVLPNSCLPIPKNSTPGSKRPDISRTALKQPAIRPAIETPELHQHKERPTYQASKVQITAQPSLNGLARKMPATQTTVSSDSAFSYRAAKTVPAGHEPSPDHHVDYTPTVSPAGSTAVRSPSSSPSLDGEHSERERYMLVPTSDFHYLSERVMELEKALSSSLTATKVSSAFLQVREAIHARVTRLEEHKASVDEAVRKQNDTLIMQNNKLKDLNAENSERTKQLEAALKDALERECRATKDSIHEKHNRLLDGWQVNTTSFNKLQKSCNEILQTQKEQKADIDSLQNKVREAGTRVDITRSDIRDIEKRNEAIDQQDDSNPSRLKHSVKKFQSEHASDRIKVASIYSTVKEYCDPVFATQTALQYFTEALNQEKAARAEDTAAIKQLSEGNLAENKGYLARIQESLDHVKQEQQLQRAKADRVTENLETRLSEHKTSIIGFESSLAAFRESQTAATSNSGGSTAPKLNPDAQIALGLELQQLRKALKRERLERQENSASIADIREALRGTLKGIEEGGKGNSLPTLWQRRRKPLAINTSIR
jgi:hypothetical protein